MLEDIPVREHKTQGAPWIRYFSFLVGNKEKTCCSLHEHNHPCFHSLQTTAVNCSLVETNSSQDMITYIMSGLKFFLKSTQSEAAS